MRRRLAFSRDTLQAALLPVTEYMELNYRPALPVPAVAAVAVMVSTGMLLFAVAALFWLLDVFGPFIGYLCNLTALLFVSFAVLIRVLVYGHPDGWTWRMVLRRGAIAIALLLIVALGVIAARGHAPILAMVPIVVVGTGFSLLCGKQFAYWTTVNPRVDWREMRLWQSIWPQLRSRTIPAECPEILTARLALLVLCVQTWLGCEAFTGLSSPERGPAVQELAGLAALAVIFVPLPLYWLVWHSLGVVPRMSLMATWNATFKSLQVWFGYLRTPTPGPGVFLLPDRWLRHAAVRQFLATAALAVTATSLLLLSHSADDSAPIGLVRMMARLLFGDSGRSVLEFSLAGVAAAAIPPLVLLVVHWFLLGSVLARYWLALEVPGGYAQSQKSPWAISVNRMLNSRDHKEREHVLLGRSLFGDYPVLLHKPLLYQHAHLVGDSGSRKTSLGIAPLIAQLVAARDCSVMVLDLKGDRSLFETARLEAAAAGAEFRWFALEPNFSSHVFNPLEQSHFSRLTANQRTQLILEGLSLNYGDAYGRGFFSAMNEVVLLNLIRHYPIASFKRLHSLLCDKQAYARIGNPEDWKKAQHLTALVDRLASMHALNLTAEELHEQPAVRDATIDMGRALSRPQVVYFHLRSPIEPIGSPAVAKLALYSLFAAAANRLPEQTQRVYVVVDEFQQVVSESVRLVFEQARSSNIHFIVAHQNVEQLDRKGIDIRDTVSSCTAFKQFFRASDPKTIKLLEEMSGQGLFETLAWRQQNDPALGPDHDHAYSPNRAEWQSVQVVETPGYRLERNTIMDISSAPNTSFVSFTEASHFTQFSSYVTPIVSDYHIGLKEYERRSTASWPAATEETVVIPQVRSPAASAAPPAGDSPDDFEDRIRRLAGQSLPER